MNIAQLRKLAATFGAEIDDDKDTELLLAWAPSGFVWCETGTHSMGRQYGNGSQRWRREAQAELADDMQAGCEPCTETDCDVCE